MLVKQAANVLDVLEFFAERKASATMSELSRHFGWPRSSTFNIVTTLVERGFLYEPRSRGSFYPTPRWLALAQEISTAEPIPEALPPVLEELATATGETVLLAAASGLHAVFIEVIESEQAVRYAAHVGKRVPIHATASGLALLSQMQPRQRDALLRKIVFEKYGSGTLMSVDAVEQDIRQAMRRGWFKSASSYSIDLGGVGVPISLQGRTFAVTVAGPLYRMEGRWDQIAIRIHEAIEDHLGHGFLETHVEGLTPLAGRTSLV